MFLMRVPLILSHNHIPDPCQSPTIATSSIILLPAFLPSHLMCCLPHPPNGMMNGEWKESGTTGGNTANRNFREMGRVWGARAAWKPANSFFHSHNSDVPAGLTCCKCHNISVEGAHDNNISSSILFPSLPHGEPGGGQNGWRLACVFPHDQESIRGGGGGQKPGWDHALLTRSGGGGKCQHILPHLPTPKRGG